MTKLYDTLDIKRSATQKEIKEAYREKSKLHHPDKGGNGKAFGAIAKSYDILSDIHKRKRYDETGIEDDVKSSATAAHGLLQRIFGDLIKKVGIEKILSTDVVGTMEKNLNIGMDKLKKEKIEAVSKKKSFEKIMRRIKHRNIHNDLNLVLRNQIENETRQLVNITRNMETVKIASEMLRDYSFKYNKAQKPQGSTFFATYSFDATQTGY